jgi:hypothetical protein
MTAKSVEHLPYDGDLGHLEDSEFERAMIRERVLAGLARAK